MTLKPGGIHHGICFVRMDCPPAHSVIHARHSSIVRTDLCTVLGNAHGATVGTVEHLMAAFAALNITNAIVEIDGPEIPACDGSSAPFIHAIERVGVERQYAEAPVIQILKPLHVRHNHSWMTVEPSDTFSIDFSFDFSLRASSLPKQKAFFQGDYASVMRQVADARTVGFFEDYEALKARGLAQGGSLENAVVYRDDQVINPEGLRYPDECVRHKILDAIGDLYLLGAPILGALTCYGSGHRLNAEVMHSLATHPDSWCYAHHSIEFPRETTLLVTTPLKHAFAQSPVFCL